MKIIAVLFNVGKIRSKLSMDSKLRILSAKEIIGNDKKAKILFVGGGGKSFGADKMCGYWKKEFPYLENETFVLSKSNNTFDNIDEINHFLENKYNKSKIFVVSNSYHKKRIKRIISACKLEDKFSFISAEEILISKNKDIEYIKKYQSSFLYKRKEFMEKCLNFLIFIDSKQRMARIWRKISYGLTFK